MKYDLADRTVAITGAAGGLGADLAKAMRTRGARIALLDLNRDAVCELADRLGGYSVARGWRADVRDLDNLDQVMTEVAAHFERLDVVVAGAGLAAPSDRLRRSAGQFARTHRSTSSDQVSLETGCNRGRWRGGLTNRVHSRTGPRPGHSADKEAIESGSTHHYVAR